MPRSDELDYTHRTRADQASGPRSAFQVGHSRGAQQVFANACVARLIPAGARQTGTGKEDFCAASPTRIFFVTTRDTSSVTFPARNLTQQAVDMFVELTRSAQSRAGSLWHDGNRGCFFVRGRP